ncbi:MAG: hypothetical protein EA396_01175 [Anaerolineaceae bacterium]|nr:MAG: hypothetical protein EA396_01175 [Anaerolineaceae bacterium]
MDLLTWIYALCALTGGASLLILAGRAFPIITDLPPAGRQAILNRMLLASALVSFGSIGLLAVGLFDFDAPHSLLSAAFFALLFTRTSFATLKWMLQRKISQERDAP